MCIVLRKLKSCGECEFESEKEYCAAYGNKIYGCKTLTYVDEKSMLFKCGHCPSSTMAKSTCSWDLDSLGPTSTAFPATPTYLLLKKQLRKGHSIRTVIGQWKTGKVN